MAQIITPSNITTYGALILPFDKEEALKQMEVQADPEEVAETNGIIISAIENSNNKSVIEQAIEDEVNGVESIDPIAQAIDTQVNKPKASVTQKIKDFATYINDNRDRISGVVTTATSKFSAIAVAQAIINGKVTSKEALDYLFMGFAPALGVTGSLFGYSGLNQMKDALFNGSIDVGAFISGFTRVLKGGKDLADMLSKKNIQTSPNIIEFDLTISHSETYQSETPDRRVQSGQSLQEYVHNMPDTFDVQCALQEGKRYSKAEFRAILKYLQEKKETVQLVLGDELFDSLIMTNFNPTHDCTKSGMDYSLSFKKITRSDVETNAKVSIQPMPKQLVQDVTKSDIGSLSGATSNNTRNNGNINNNNNNSSGNDNDPPWRPFEEAKKWVVKTIKDLKDRTQLYKHTRTGGRE